MVVSLSETGKCASAGCQARDAQDAARDAATRATAYGAAWHDGFIRGDQLRARFLCQSCVVLVRSRTLVQHIAAQVVRFPECWMLFA